MRVTPAGVGKLHRSRHQRHVRARLARRGGHRKAHFSRTAIGQIAHRIQAFARRSGRDQYVETGQQAGIQGRLEQGLGQLGRLPHAPRADFTAGLTARTRTEDTHSARNQGVDVRLRGLVRPHDAIHRRREHDGRLGGEAQRRQEIIGAAAGQTRDEIRARGCYQHELRPAGKFDVTHGGFRRAVPQVAAGGPAGHRLEAYGCDEPLRACGHHHLHFGAALGQPAHQLRTLVGGDAAGDAEQNTSLGRQWMPLNSLKRAISLSNCLLIVASSERFSRRFSSCV